MALSLPDARQLSDEVLEALRLRALRGCELGFTEAEIADLLGVSLEVIGDTTLLRVADRLCAVRFTLAVLRDVFPDDDAVRRWLRTPRSEFGGRSGLELVLAGRLRAVEELAMREWHRPSVAAPVYRPRVQVPA